MSTWEGVDLAAFYAGRDFEAWRWMGARLSGDGADFRVLAPAAAGASVLLGTPDGELIPQRTDVSGKVLEYKKDKDGKTVVTKLDEQSLAALAQATQGVYIKYTTPAQVAAKVEESVRDLDRSRSAASSRARYKNRYQIPLLLAVLCLGLWLALPFKARSIRAETDEKR